MLFKSKMVAILSALFVSTSLSAFAQDGNSQNASEQASNPAKVMAVIDGKDVTVGQLNDMALNIDPNLARLPEPQRLLSTLRIYIDMVALSQAAVSAGLDKGEEFNQRLALARDNVLQQLYLKNEIMDKISDAELKAFYDKEVAKLNQEEEVHARHILVKTKQEAEDIIKRLEKGESFAQLAKDNSTDGSAAVGGDLGYFSKGQMVEPFETAAFALKKGEFSKTPVETPFGWHIIEVEDIRQKQPPSFEDVKDALLQMLTRDRYLAVIAQLRQKVDVKYPDATIGAEMSKPITGIPGDEEEGE